MRRTVTSNRATQTRCTNKCSVKSCESSSGKRPQLACLQQSRFADAHRRHRSLRNHGRGRLRIVANAPEGNNKAVSISMPQIRTGAAYTFILAGFLKIMLAYIPGKQLVRTPLGEMTPYLMIPFGLALCLIGKVVCDLQLHERAPKAVLAIIAAVVVAFFSIASASFDWKESKRVAVAEYLQEQRAALGPRAPSPAQIRQAQAAARAAEEDDLLLLQEQLERDHRYIPDKLRAGAQNFDFSAQPLSADKYEREAAADMDDIDSRLARRWAAGAGAPASQRFYTDLDTRDGR